MSRATPVTPDVFVGCIAKPRHSSFPRRRESILADRGGIHLDQRLLIPAFAGMTISCWLNGAIVEHRQDNEGRRP